MSAHAAFAIRRRSPTLLAEGVTYPSETGMTLMDQAVVTTFVPWSPLIMGGTVGDTNVPDVGPAATGIAECQYDFDHASGDPLWVYGTESTVLAGGVSRPVKDKYVAGSGMNNRYHLEANIIFRPVAGMWRAAMAQNRSVHEENDANERVRENTTTDITAWSGANVKVLAENPGDGYNYSGGAYFPFTDGTLYYVAPSFQGTSTTAAHFKNLATILLRCDNEGTEVEAWTRVGIICDIWPLQQPVKMDDGNWICAGGDANARPHVMISQGDSISLPWTKIAIPVPSGWPIPSYNEVNVMVSGNIVQAIIRPPTAGNAYTAISRNYGRTGSWRRARADGMVIQNKKPSATVLSNGVKVAVTTFSGLDNVVATFTDVGGIKFKYALDLNSGSPPSLDYPFDPNTGEAYGYSITYYTGTPTYNSALNGGHGAYERTGTRVNADSKRGWIYPYLYEYGGHLYVVYSQNHEAMIGKKIPINTFIAQKTPSISPIANWSFSEADGAATFTDDSGNGHTLTGVGTATTRWDGPHNGSFSRYFGGASAMYATGLNSTLMGPFTPFTYEVWVKFDTANSSADRFLMGIYENAKYAFGVQTDHQASVVDAIVAVLASRGSVVSGIFKAKTSIVPSANTWMRIVYRYDCGSLRIWLNNTEITALTTTGEIPPGYYFHSGASLMLGGIGPYTSPSLYHKGFLSKPKVWNRALSEAEILANYVAPTSPDYSAYSAKTRLLLNACTNRINSSDATNINNLMNTLDDNGAGVHVLARLDFLCVFAAGDTQLARLNWVNPDAADNQKISIGTINGAPAFTAYVGYEGDGINAYYINTMNPGDGGTHLYQQNDCCIGEYIAENVNESGGDMGNTSAFLQSRLVDGSTRTRLNSAATSTVVSAGGATDSRGLWILNRNSPANYKVWKNGSTIATPSSASSALANSTIVFGAGPSGSGNRGSKKISLGFAGAALSDAEIAVMQSAWNTYKTAVGL